MFAPDLSIVIDLGFGLAKRDRLEVCRADLRDAITATKPGLIVY